MCLMAAGSTFQLLASNFVPTGSGWWIVPWHTDPSNSQLSCKSNKYTDTEQITQSLLMLLNNNKDYDSWKYICPIVCIDFMHSLHSCEHQNTTMQHNSSCNTCMMSSSFSIHVFGFTLALTYLQNESDDVRVIDPLDQFTGQISTRDAQLIKVGLTDLPFFQSFVASVHHTESYLMLWSVRWAEPSAFQTLDHMKFKSWSRLSSIANIALSSFNFKLNDLSPTLLN